jgi:hypothetical protein
MITNFSVSTLNLVLSAHAEHPPRSRFCHVKVTDITNITNQHSGPYYYLVPRMHMEIAERMHKVTWYLHTRVILNENANPHMARKEAA